MPNIIFYLNTGKEVKVTQEEFDAVNLSEVLMDPRQSYIDMGIRGFQKHSLVAWGPEEGTSNEQPEGEY